MKFLKDTLGHTMRSRDTFDKTITERQYSRVMWMPCICCGSVITKQQATSKGGWTWQGWHSLMPFTRSFVFVPFVSPHYHCIFNDAFETVVININFGSQRKENAKLNSKSENEHDNVALVVRLPPPMSTTL